MKTPNASRAAKAPTSYGKHKRAAGKRALNKSERKAAKAATKKFAG
jgi:hypothetical protein